MWPSFTAFEIQSGAVLHVRVEMELYCMNRSCTACVLQAQKTCGQATKLDAATFPQSFEEYVER